jgi:hypothetical protein
LIKVYINYFVSRKFLIFCFHAVIIVHVREKDLIKKNKDVWCASGSIWLGVGVHSTAGGFSYLGLERLHLLLQSLNLRCMLSSLRRAASSAKTQGDYS